MEAVQSKHILKSVHVNKENVHAHTNVRSLASAMRDQRQSAALQSLPKQSITFNPWFVLLFIQNVQMPKTFLLLVNLIDMGVSFWVLYQAEQILCEKESKTIRTITKIILMSINLHNFKCSLCCCCKKSSMNELNANACINILAIAQTVIITAQK